LITLLKSFTDQSFAQLPDSASSRAQVAESCADAASAAATS